VNIQILSRQAAEAYIPPLQPTILISISDTNSPDPVFQGQYHDVLRLKFFDTLDAQCMTDEQAAEVAAFLKRAFDAYVTEMVVHCEAGISRSAGTAAATWALLGEPVAPAFAAPHHPNAWVLSKIVRAWTLAATKAA
jgi:predicted protein tyrosine phosphatase